LAEANTCHEGGDRPDLHHELYDRSPRANGPSASGILAIIEPVPGRCHVIAKTIWRNPPYLPGITRTRRSAPL